MHQSLPASTPPLAAADPAMAASHSAPAARRYWQPLPLPCDVVRTRNISQNSWQNPLRCGSKAGSRETRGPQPVLLQPAEGVLGTASGGPVFQPDMAVVALAPQVAEQEP